MTLEEIYFLVEIAAGLAVITSLVYVAVQIQQNTRATKLAGVQAVQAAIGRVEELIIQDHDFADIVRRGMGEQELTDTDRIRVNVFYRHALRTYQSAHYQYRNGALQESVWVPQARTLAAIFQADKGIRDSYETEKYMLDPSFAEFCGRLIKDEVTWPITSGYKPTML